MSKKTQVEEESRVIVGAHGVAAEEDHLVLGKVIRVGVLSLLIFGVSAVVAWRGQVNLEREFQPDGPPPKPIAIGQYEIGIVNQRMFEQDSHATEKLEGQHKALEAGTGDQPGVVAHLPLEKAMDQVIADAAKPPPPPPAPPAPEPTSPQGKAPAPAPGGKAPAQAPAPAPTTPAAPAPTPH
ncbi:hypothetical protein [Hyalangium versicolor]|uniref:hypothetical protein n=1 Tax=Hyalangium versicolor TaxID=2861190 RepID=UPI001CCFD87B|nr:hypothetical protein [Hyalangium versicolor]